jgi:type II secretory pathway predicted ATPase ExeA
MFLDFYKLREQPFGVTPDPRYLYLSATHKEALASLYYGIEAGRGFLALIAKPGMGKTTLLFQLLERLQGSARTIFLFQTQCDLREFFRYLLADLGVDSSSLDLVEMHEKLNEMLLREARAKRRFVLVVDEAQNLDDTVLESVRLLSDFETPSSKLMQIVLAGQPQLAEKLVRPELVQLRQRISMVSRIQPLTPGETNQYIEHRLRVAGSEGGSPFKPEALALIAERSEGIPRNINNLCFNALTLGYALKRKAIERSVVEEVLADLELDTLAPKPALPRFEGPVEASDSLEQVSQPAAPALELPAEPRSFERPTLPARARGFGRWGLAAALTALLIALAGLVSISLSGNRNGPESAAPVQAPQAEAGERAPASALGTITVVVEQRQTLQGISQQNLGGFDPKLLQEILQLNPDLHDPNRIEVGQRIVLPRPARYRGPSQQAGRAVR